MVLIEKKTDLLTQPNFTISPYQPANRAEVFHIAAETAYFGRAVEAYLDDRRLFCEAFYAYYTDLEPEHGWVALKDGRVVGFLMGSWDTALQKKRWLRGVLPKVIRQSLGGRYTIGRKTWRYLWELLRGELSGENAPVDLALYPAHLHVNVDPNCQGQGIGRCLMEAYLRQLQVEGVPGVHLHTTSANQVAVYLYHKLGFKEISSHPNAYFTRLLSTPVSNLCFARQISLKSAEVG